MWLIIVNINLNELADHKPLPQHVVAGQSITRAESRLAVDMAGYFNNANNPVEAALKSVNYDTYMNAIFTLVDNEELYGPFYFFVDDDGQVERMENIDQERRGRFGGGSREEAKTCG